MVLLLLALHMPAAVVAAAGIVSVVMVALVVLMLLPGLSYCWIIAASISSYSAPKDGHHKRPISNHHRPAY